MSKPIDTFEDDLSTYGRDDLRARLAAVKAGDTVTATFYGYAIDAPVTVTSEVHRIGGTLWLGEYRLRQDAEPGSWVKSLDSHTPATPPEPTGDVLVKDHDGHVWSLFPEGWSNGIQLLVWPEFVRKHGPVIVYVPREKGKTDE